MSQENKKYGVVGVVCIVLLALGYLFYTVAIKATAPASSGDLVQSGVETVDTRVSKAYGKLSNLDFTLGDTNLTSALETFRDVAIDENNSKLQRAQALNGINYAYTGANFDASDVYRAVFAKPPYSEYFVAPTSSRPDSIHPENGYYVESVENALVKLNELSNALYPNHYAIVRLEIANAFASNRASAGLPAAAQRQIKVSYANKIKELVAAYDSLPALDSLDSSYPPAMKMQIMFVHASALSFMADALNDASASEQGEILFQKVIQKGEEYAKAGTATPKIRNATLMARIFYASHYWSHYKDANPEKITLMLNPLVLSDSHTAAYSQYLPSHKTAATEPFSTLRDIAKQMPELKTFLEGRGWKF